MAKGEAQVVDRRAPRLAAKLTLPSGKVVVMRALYGAEQLAAHAEADAIGGGNEAKRDLALTWALQKRALVSVDGEPYAQSDRTAESFADEFTPQEHMGLSMLFSQVHGIEKEELERFRSTIQWEASS